MKKLLFIIPPSFNVEDYISDITDKYPVFTTPYGILSITSYIKKYSNFELDIKILDLNLEVYNLSEKKSDPFNIMTELINDMVLQFNPDFIAIAALFNVCFPYLETISKAIEELECNVPLLIGGGVATNLYKDVLQGFPRIDAACYAEGEIPVFELVSAENAHEYLRNSKAWVTRESLAAGHVPVPQFVEDLDEIPLFDYSIINVDQYQGRAFSLMYRENKNRELSIHTSRGCPFNCIFCANGTVHGKKIRYLSVSRVISDVKNMVEKYGINVLLIEDDHFLSNKARAKEILRELCKFNIRLEFPNGLAVYAIDDEIAELLKRAGTVTATLAVESGSDYVLEHIINKPLKTHMVKKAVDYLKKYDINVHGFFVLGLPGELQIHRNETLQLMKTAGFDWVYPFIATPIAGSRLYDECKKNGYLVDANYSNFFMSKGNIKTPEIEPEEIEKQVYLMNLETNFVYNSNLLMGKYHKVIDYLKPIAKKYPDHAFSHYYLAECYRKLNERDHALRHRIIFEQIIAKSSTWNEYAKKFKLQ